MVSPHREKKTYYDFSAEGRYINYRHAMNHEDHLSSRGSAGGSNWGYMRPDSVSTGYYYDQTTHEEEPPGTQIGEKEKKKKAVSVFNCYEKFVMVTFVDF